MSQVITNAFEHYWQSSLAAEQPVVLDEFILADIPNLDITSPIDPDTGLPPESQIVHRQNVDQRGRINNNAVAYTIVMDTTVGDFSFNAMYLRNKANGVIGMIVYKGRETKLKTDQTTGQTGNSLVKSMLMGYDQAAEATLTNVDAGTWQIDYAARLRGQDEDLRQLASQLYGHHTFIGDGFKVVQQDGGHQVTQGVAIVGGLRIELKQPQVIYPGNKPIGVWVDVHRSGSLLSEHQNHFTIITSVAELADHVDSNGYPHYVAKLGTILADSTIEDGRGSADGGSGGAGSIPDTFALWKRSMAEAGYDLIGQFGTALTIETAEQVVLSKDGKDVYAWSGELPKVIDKTSSPEDGGWRAVKEDSLRKNIKSDLVKCKYGALNVFTDMTAYGPSVGIKTTNTPAQNTAALEAIRQIKGLRLHIPAGTFQFDVFRTAGLLEVLGAGKDLTIVTLTAVGSQVSVQFDKSTVRGIHFKSVAGSLEWQRTTYGTNVELFDCKISNFLHESPAPNSWGAYFKDAKNCKLTRVEFDGNSQSDIAILEGTENLVIDGCFHSSGQLFINMEPNNNDRRMRGIELRSMDINKLSILNNDLNSQAEDVVSIIGCAVGTLLYDGLGATFINTSISKVIPSPDNQSRLYGADVRGLRVDTRELVPDPIFSNLSSPGGSIGWTTGYVTLPPVDRYNRNAEGALVLNPNAKTGLVWLYSGKFHVQENTSYLISLCRTVMLPGTRPDIHYIKFFDASQVEIPNTSCTINQYVSPNEDKKLFRTVFKAPPGTAYVELMMQNDDSSNHQQTVAYHFVSVRKVLTNGNGVDCVTVNYENNLRRITLPLTKAQFDAAQYYHCPIPVGSEIEFAYSAGGARLAKVVVKAADNTGKFGTLQIIANYP